MDNVVARGLLILMAFSTSITVLIMIRWIIINRKENALLERLIEIRSEAFVASVNFMMDHQAVSLDQMHTLNSASSALTEAIVREYSSFIMDFPLKRIDDSKWVEAVEELEKR